LKPLLTYLLKIKF